jgi:thiamine monophosphate synthase
VSIPVFAIGGIDLPRVKAVMETGVDGIAVMSGLMQDHAPDELVSSYYKLMKKSASP